MSTTDKVLVFVAIIAEGFTMVSSSANSCFFTARSSTTDSIMRSQLARSERLAVALRRDKIFALSSAVIFSRCTCLSSPLVILAIIASAADALRERTMTVKPALAATSARPEPMIPEPRMATVEIVFAVCCSDI